MHNIQKIIFNKCLWLSSSLFLLNGCHNMDSFFHDTSRDVNYDYSAAYTPTEVTTDTKKNMQKKVVTNNAEQPTAATLTSTSATGNKAAVPLDAPAVPGIAPTVGQ